MNRHLQARPRAVALLLAATALPATTAIAQEAAAPPVVTAQPASPPAAAAPAPAAAAPTFAPQSPVVQNVPPPGPRTPVVEEAAAPEPAAAPIRRARPAARPAAVRAAPVAVAPVVTPAPTVTPAPATEPVMPLAEAPAQKAAPAPVPADPVDPVSETDPGDTSWLYILGGLAALAGLIALFVFARRRQSADVYEETYVEPVAVAPVIAPEPTVAYAPPVAPVPVAVERPQVELNMRPVRAGSDGDDARVDFELTVENSSGVPAHDVKVSTWMLSRGASDAERLLIDPPAEAELTRMTLEPSAAKRVDVSLAMPASDVHVSNGDGTLGYTPIVVADARYPLPDGGEGRISAAFAVGVADGAGGIAPLAIDDATLHEDVGAALHGELERA